MALFEDNDPEQADAGDRELPERHLGVLGVLRAPAGTSCHDTNEAYKFGINEFIYGITH